MPTGPPCLRPRFAAAELNVPQPFAELPFFPTNQALKKRGFVNGGWFLSGRRDPLFIVERLRQRRAVRGESHSEVQPRVSSDIHRKALADSRGVAKSREKGLECSAAPDQGEGLLERLCFLSQRWERKWRRRRGRRGERKRTGQWEKGVRVEKKGNWEGFHSGFYVASYCVTFREVSL